MVPPGRLVVLCIVGFCAPSSTRAQEALKPAGLGALPAQPSALTARVEERALEILDARTRRPIDVMGLPQPGLAMIQRGDAVYVAHERQISVVNLSTRQRQPLPVALDTAEWTWAVERDRLLVRSAGQLPALFDITDPTRPILIPGIVSDAAFMVPIRPKRPPVHHGYRTMAAIGGIMGIRGLLFLAAGLGMGGLNECPRYGECEWIYGRALFAAGTVQILIGIPLFGIGVYKLRHNYPRLDPADPNPAP